MTNSPNVEDLQQGALQFKRGASRVRKQMWWKNMKLNLIIAAIVIAILIIVIGTQYPAYLFPNPLVVPIAVSLKKSS